MGSNNFKPPRGLQNMGNTCYANSIFQALSSIPTFPSRLRALCTRLTSSSDDNEFIYALTETISDIQDSILVNRATANTAIPVGEEGKIVTYLGFPLPTCNSGGSVIVPFWILKVFFGDSSFLPGEQQDAHEFLNILLGKIRKVCVDITTSAREKCEHNDIDMVQSRNGDGVEQHPTDGDDDNINSNLNRNGGIYPKSSACFETKQNSKSRAHDNGLKEHSKAGKPRILKSPIRNLYYESSASSRSTVSVDESLRYYNTYDPFLSDDSTTSDRNCDENLYGGGCIQSCFSAPSETKNFRPSGNRNRGSKKEESEHEGNDKFSVYQFDDVSFKDSEGLYSLSETSNQGEIYITESHLQDAGHTPFVGRKNRKNINYNQLPKFEGKCQSLKFEKANGNCKKKLRFQTDSEHERKGTEYECNGKQNRANVMKGTQSKKPKQKCAEDITMDFITYLFSGSANQITECTKCETRRCTDEHFYELSIPVHPNESIEWSLKSLRRVEHLNKTNKLHCETCNCKQSARLWWDVKSLPLLTVIHPKVFEFIGQISLKAPFEVVLGLLLSDHPKDCINGSSVYELVSFVCFQKNASRHENDMMGVDGGHYLCFVLCKDLGWFCVDDDYVDFVDEVIVRRVLDGDSKNSTPYLLFYVHESIMKVQEQ